jgi:hypothetical protein
MRKNKSSEGKFNLTKSHQNNHSEGKLNPKPNIQGKRNQAEMEENYFHYSS